MNNLAEELFPSPGYAVRPENATDLRVVRISQNRAKATEARKSRKLREAIRTASGLCIKCGENAVNGKKVCYACVRLQRVYTARSVLTRYGYNPDSHSDLVLP